MPFKVKVSAAGRVVKFSIDHQTFTIEVPEPTLKRLRWYARQLRVALRRLQREG